MPYLRHASPGLLPCRSGAGTAGEGQPRVRCTGGPLTWWSESADGREPGCLPSQRGREDEEGLPELPPSPVPGRSGDAALPVALDRPGTDVDACFQAAGVVLAPSRPATAWLVVACTVTLGLDYLAVWAFARHRRRRHRVGPSAAPTGRVGPGEGVQLGTVLIAREMVTNAVRHASTPVTLRLIRQETLVCEVPDGSRVSPHLHCALPGDESGRMCVSATVEMRATGSDQNRASLRSRDHSGFSGAGVRRKRG